MLSLEVMTAETYADLVERMIAIRLNDLAAKRPLLGREADMSFRTESVRSPANVAPKPTGHRVPLMHSPALI